MTLPGIEMQERFEKWLDGWNNHDLEAVMDFFHEEIIFENWDGKSIAGKESLKRAWMPWFFHHGGFRFHRESLFFDEKQQVIVFQWKLEWPSNEEKFRGQKEMRQGVDVMQLKDGKILKKMTYSKTAVQIGNNKYEIHL